MGTAEAGDPGSLTAAVARLVEENGPADVLLYNVAVGREVSVPDLAPETLLADLAAGAVGLQTAVRAVLPGMRARGVQKAALRALAEVQAIALADDGVHVATVTVRGFVGEDRRITPDRVASLYADLVAETPGPQEGWRTVVDLTG